jgi:hypothetical protein
VDDAITAAYGMRANEQAIRLSVQNVAVFASISFSATDPDAQERYAALTGRISAGLSEAPGQQEINDIMADLATAQVTLGAAKDRHQQTNGVLSNLLDHVEGVSMEEVGAQILALNTRLQASLQTTAMLYQMSLVNYL